MYVCVYIIYVCAQKKSGYICALIYLIIFLFDLHQNGSKVMSHICQVTVRRAKPKASPRTLSAKKKIYFFVPKQHMHDVFRKKEM